MTEHSDNGRERDSAENQEFIAMYTDRKIIRWCSPSFKYGCYSKKMALDFKLHQIFHISLIQRGHRHQDEFQKAPDIDYSTSFYFTDAKWAYRGLLYLISSDRLNLSLSWSITLARLKCIAAFELKFLWILWNSLSILSGIVVEHAK